MEQGEHLVDWLYQIRCDLKQSVFINVSLRASQSTLHGISVDMPDGQGGVLVTTQLQSQIIIRIPLTSL